jgi:hypothetical protein
VYAKKIATREPKTNTTAMRIAKSLADADFCVAISSAKYYVRFYGDKPWFLHNVATFFTSSLALLPVPYQHTYSHAEFSLLQAFIRQTV